MGRIVAICNQKGGVGKTTTAINLAAYLALQQRPTLLVDLDPQGNATTGLGIDKKTVAASVYHLLIDQASPDDILKATQVERLTLLPSNVQLAGFDVEMGQAPTRHEALKAKLAPLKDQFEYILVDCPPSLGLLTVNALAAADGVLIPVQCEFYALEGLTQLLETIEFMRSSLNPQLMIDGVILTMADYRTNLTQEVIEEIRRFFHDKVYETVIPRNVKLSEAPGYGKPIFIHDSSSQGAHSYQNIGDEFLRRTTGNATNYEHISNISFTKERTESDGAPAPI